MRKAKGSDLKTQVIRQILDSAQSQVWTASDFATLGSRAALDKVLQRLVATRELRRIDRGLYDRPTRNELTGKATVPDYRAVIQAVARRDKVRLLLDGMTAANDLGLTTAVPARIEVLVDARLRPIRVGNQTIHFKTAAPSRLFWAGRPRCGSSKRSTGSKTFFVMRTSASGPCKYCEKCLTTRSVETPFGMICRYGKDSGSLRHLSSC